MKIITENDPVPEGLKTVVTVGNFDGVHRGHARLIARAVGLARERGAAAAAVTFEPHTRSVVYPELSTMLLTTFAEKAALMAKMGVDCLFCLNFDEKFRLTGQDEFVEKVLAERLNASAWVMGEGHHVGRDRGGGKKNLHFVCGKYHINTFAEPPEIEGEAVISSTRIRGLVAEGRMEEAARMLGRPYLIAAERVRGVGVATKNLKCPTLNFRRPEAGKVIPPAGVYAAEVEIIGGARVGVNTGGISANGINANGIGADGINTDDISAGGISAKKNRRLFGALYFGDCPTYANRDTHFEFHALNFGGADFIEPAAGEGVRLWLHKFIRPNIAFPSESALKGQIALDVNEIKKIFSEERQ
jgi:riboflavin kinase/FMN adenylyltransferase